MKWSSDGNRGSWGCLLLALAQMLLLAPELTNGAITAGMVNIYLDRTFLIFYNSNTPTTFKYQILVSNTGQAALADIVAEDISCDNESHGQLFKFCIVKVPELDNDKYRENFKEPIDVLFQDEDGNNVTVSYDGRNIKPASLADPTAASSVITGLITAAGSLPDPLYPFGTDNDNFTNDVGGFWLPVQVELFSINTNLKIKVSYTASPFPGTLETTFGAIPDSQAIDSQIGTAGVTSISVDYGNDDYVCGIELTGDGQSAQQGCTNPAQSIVYNIDDGWGLIGFFAIVGSVNLQEKIIILPLQYQVLPPVLQYYTLPDDRSLHAAWRNDWSVTLAILSLSIQDSRDEMGMLMTSDYARLVVTQELDSHYFELDVFDEFFGNLPSGSLACTPFTLSLTPLDGSSRVYAEMDLDAWTLAYTSLDADTLSSSSATDITGGTYSSPENLNYVGSDNCVQPTFFDDLSVGFLSGILYSNDVALGPAIAIADPGSQSFGGAHIDKVDVFFESNQGDLRAIDFYSGDTRVVTLGTAGGITAMTSVAPQSNARLARVEAVLNNAETVTRQLTFTWQVPSAPWNIYHSGLMKKPASLGDSGFTAGYRPDVQVIKFWSPPTPDGEFGLALTNNDTEETYNLTLSTERNETTGADYKGKLFNLDAETTYSFTVYGMLHGENKSAHSDLATFHTGSGFQMSCENGGDMTTLISYEALPHAVPIFEDTDAILFGDAPLSVTVSAENVQNIFTNTAKFFQYESDVSVPTGFYGFPIAVQLAAPSSYSFFTSLGITYSDGEGGNFTEWIAGGNDDMEEMQTIDTPNGTFISGFDYSKDNSGRLNGLLLLDTSDQSIEACIIVGGGDCAQPGSRQSQLTATQNKESYKVYSLKATISDDYANDPGIFGLQLQFAYIDPPELVYGGCTVDPMVDYSYLHNTHWLSTVNVQNAATCNVITNVYKSAASSPISAPAISYTTSFQRAQDVANMDPIDGEEGIQIVRASSFQINTVCYYEANATVDSTFDTMAEHAQDATSLSEFDFQIQIAKAADYASFYGTDEVPSVDLNEVIYMQVSLANDLANYTVVATECYATKTNDQEATQRYVIENSTCDADSSFERPSAPTSVDQFHFTTFTWYDAPSAYVYLHCVVRACPDDDASLCQLPDACIGSRERMRRGASPNEYVRMNEFETQENRERRGTDQSLGFKEELISYPHPIFIRNRRHVDTEMLSIERDVAKPIYQHPLVLVSTAFSLLALLSFLVVSFKAGSWYKRASRYELLTNENNNHQA